jgi:hypothetical protein
MALQAGCLPLRDGMHSRLVLGATLLVAWIAAAFQTAPSGAPDVDKLDTAALLALTEQVGARATERLLALPADLEQLHADALAVPDAQAARLLVRGWHDVPPKRGGGAYYSFATQDHDYDREPDLDYQRGELSTGFYGGSTGHVLDLGPVALASFRPQAPPPELDPAVARQCEVLWSFEAQDDRPGDALGKALGTEDFGWSPAVAGHTYLLRAILPGEHDHLVAFTVLEASPESVVLVGHVLKTWPIARRRSEPRPRRDFSSAGAPDWLLQLDDQRLAALATQLMEKSEVRLITAPKTCAAALGGLPQGTNAGVTRLLPNGKYDWLATSRSDNSYFSFATQGHSLNEEADLQWKLEHFFTGICGPSAGAFLDLGNVELAAVDLASPPAGLTAAQRARWDELQAPDVGQGVCSVCGRVPAIVGHTYLLRSQVGEKHDVLVVFRPVDQDERGMSIAWRMLRRFSPP